MASKSESPLQPKTILRGHKSQVHAVAFIRNNERLVTGDADGYVIAWDLAIMRPRAVWQAHDSSILGLAGWQTDRIITYAFFLTFFFFFFSSLCYHAQFCHPDSTTRPIFSPFCLLTRMASNADAILPNLVYLAAVATARATSLPVPTLEVDFFPSS